jgi:hypothetical protein
MKRRSKWVIVICLLLLAGAGVWILWPASGEPELVAKARTLRKGMIPAQVAAVLGQPDEITSTLPTAVWMEWHKYRRGHNLLVLFSWKPPYVHPVEYWKSYGWDVDVQFEYTFDGKLELDCVRYRNERGDLEILVR